MKNLILSFWLLAVFTAFSQADLEIYPNPFEKELFLRSTPHCGDSLALQMLDLHGIEIFYQSYQAQAEDTLSSELQLDAGIYIIRYTEEGKSTSRKIVYHGNAATAKLNLIIAKDSVECSDQPFEVYPNPSTEPKFWLVQSDMKLPYEYSLHDVNGKLLWQENLQNRTSAKHLLDLCSHPTGIFFLRISSARGTETKKLILLR